MCTAIARREAHPGIIVRILKHRVGVPIVVLATVLGLILPSCSRNPQVAFHGGFGVGLGLTPGSNIASFFSPLDFPDGPTEQARLAFLQVMADQNYAVQQYVDTNGGKDDMPQTATALNLGSCFKGRASFIS
jgi:hypothetical protein